MSDDGPTSADAEAALRQALACLAATPEAALSAVQRGHREHIHSFLVEHGPVALTRACLPGHLTGSCLLWSADGSQVLLHHHKKLDLWLQFGGHCDGDGDVRRVARRETVEESGIEPTFVTPVPVDFDVHVIPARAASERRPAEPEHLHLDVRYLALAPERARESCSEESLALAWLTPDQARERELDESLLRILELGPPAR